MAKRWTLEEESRYRDELVQLYVTENKTIGEIATTLKMADSSIFQRIQRLGIPSRPQDKPGYLRKRKDVVLPSLRSERLAEFFGVMLGDGHISHFQTIVTLGTKELAYVRYVARLMLELFAVPATILRRKNGYRDVYIGSVELTKWLRSSGLTGNKVRAQVGAPSWIFERKDYMRAFLRGFFDTDGSVYRLRFGKQISLTNHSLPLLMALRTMLIALEFSPSEISPHRIYLTRKRDVDRFFSEIRPANAKHLRRFKNLTRR